MEKIAIIIDNRPSKELDEIILHHKKFLPKDWEIKHISNIEINNLQDYNNILISKEFWHNLPEKVLIFQHDSLLLREGIDEFLQYDFIGAPIKSTNCFNGGLSLRSRDMMLQVIEKIPYTGEHEDMYFSKGVRALGGNLPSKNIASSFSVETEFSLGSLGVHAINKHLSAEQCYQILTQYNAK